jgi:hypothetical protein
MRFLLLFVSALLIMMHAVPDAEAQSLPEPRQSPVGVSRVMVGDAYFKVVYGRPHVRDRQVFGSLVPFGEVWRTGANEATEITVTEDIQFGDKPLSAGTYSLFTIPERNEWTVIINRQLGQWGSYAYSESHDVMRLRVPTRQTPQPVEIFTISFERLEDDRANMIIEWERTRLEIPLSR